MWHVVGWAAFTAEALLGVGGAWWLWDSAKERRSWMVRVRAPKPVKHIITDGGSDYVGWV